MILKKPSCWLVAGSLIGAFVAGSGNAAPPIAAEKFAAIQAAIKPYPAEEKWKQIPWLSSLWEARRQAAAQGKPILLWEMDGNPLGCT